MTSGIPRGPLLGPVLFNITTDDMDSGTECAFFKSASNIKLSGAADTLQQRDAIQQDPDRLERWAYTALVELHEVRCKAWINAVPNISTDWVRNALRAALQRRFLFWWT